MGYIVNQAGGHPVAHRVAGPVQGDGQDLQAGVPLDQLAMSGADRRSHARTPHSHSAGRLFVSVMAAVLESAAEGLVFRMPGVLAADRANDGR